MALDIKLGNKEKRLLVVVTAVFLFAFVGPQFLGDYALRYRQTQEGAKVQYEREISAIRQDLGSIEDRKEILRRYISRYQTLVEKNVLSLPAPVELVKHMKDITTERKQGATQFQFDDNVVLPSDATAYTKDSTIGVNVYPLNVEMGMLHDMDIFMFMESLEDKVPNISFPVRCSIVLNNPDFALVDRENMRGACRINWYAVVDPRRNEDDADGEESVQGRG